MDESRPIIHVSHLRIERDITILDGINWQVVPGQHWCILGANGSGKTSLLNALTAYLTFSQGKIEVCGQVYGTTDWRELRKKIGLMSSSILQRIEDSQTAMETIVSGKYAMLNYWGEISESDRTRGMKVLHQIECEHLADRRWRSLSQGERQRVGIGRALMADPEVLFLDEPSAGLDPVARENFLHFLDQIGREKSSPTLVLVTHHVEEIVSSFTHVLILKSGRILASGTKEKVLNSTTLSRAFDAPITIRKVNSRYKMSINSPENTGRPL